MHLIESYSLASSSKIDKPFILTKFFPILPEKYITLHPFSKYQSKNYDYWLDVVDILIPELLKHGIHIVQIGAQGERILSNVYNTVGQTSINQSAFIISNSILHLGADSFATHIASAYGKPIVCLYSNNFANVVRPYWSNQNECVLLEPDRSKRKPSFSAEEPLKSINEIKPETIALSVFKLLNIDYKYGYETIHMGNKYHNRYIEVVPNQAIDPKIFNLDSIVVRMDFLFDESYLEKQLQICPCSIITNKPISSAILKQYKPRIKEFIYIIDNNHDPQFVNELLTYGLNTALFCSFSDEDYEKIKLDYIDSPIINRSKPLENEIIKYIKTLNRKVFFSSSKKTFSNGKFYSGKAAWIKNRSCALNENFFEIIDCQEFWEELDFFKFLLEKPAN